MTIRVYNTVLSRFSSTGHGIVFYLRRHYMETRDALLIVCEGNRAVTDEFLSPRAGNTEPRCFLCCISEQIVEQKVE